LNEKNFNTEFISTEELNKLKLQIDWCKVEKHKDPTDNDLMNNSEIAFIKKKS